MNSMLEMLYYNKYSSTLQHKFARTSNDNIFSMKKGDTLEFEYNPELFNCPDEAYGYRWKVIIVYSGPGIITYRLKKYRLDEDIHADDNVVYEEEYDSENEEEEDNKYDMTMTVIEKRTSDEYQTSILIKRSYGLHKFCTTLWTSEDRLIQSKHPVRFNQLKRR